MRSIICIFGAVALLAGCGLKTYSSGIQKLGPDTFVVSADDLNASTAKRTALQMANAHCAGLSREILVSNTIDTASGPRMVSDVTFLCLAKDDPQLTRPSYRTPPAVRIEDARK